jgi:hypothetical protein
MYDCSIKPYENILQENNIFTLKMEAAAAAARSSEMFSYTSLYGIPTQRTTT